MQSPFVFQILSTVNANSKVQLMILSSWETSFIVVVDGVVVAVWFYESYDTDLTVRLLQGA